MTAGATAAQGGLRAEQDELGAAQDKRRLETFDVLGSTSEEALVRAREGERGPLWIVARRQTAGRGRRGRTWISDPGNLHASLLLGDPCPAGRAPELSFVAALALHDAVVETAPVIGPRATLKWPNDLLIDGAKAGGILVEGERAASALVVVIGIGVNCLHHPGDTPYPATDLAAAGATVTADAVMTALAATMAARLAQWARGEGFASIRADWLRRAGGVGGDIRVVTGGREIVGRFETLDPAGRLVLRLPGGDTELVSAGDVFPMDAVAAPSREAAPTSHSGADPRGRGGINPSQSERSPSLQPSPPQAGALTGEGSFAPTHGRARS